MALWRLRAAVLVRLKSNFELHPWGLTRHISVLSRSIDTHPGPSISQASSPDDVDITSLYKRTFVYNDYITPPPANILENSLAAYFPINNESGTLQAIPSFLQLGYQHAYFRPDLTRDMLCEDGTDVKFLPGPADIWSYRLWAGGSVTLHSRLFLDRTKDQPMTLFERASDARAVTKDGKTNRVFVTIERTFAMGHDGPVSEDDPLKRSSTTTDNRIQFMTETENICFLRDPPSSLQDTRRIKPPSNPIFTHIIRPTRDLLFQFSALTYNAHRIHLDPGFARQIYGAKDMVVHGPLTQVLMAWFLRSFLKQHPSSHTSIVVPIKIDYTNLQPLYVNESLILSCKPTSEFANRAVNEVRAWQVWIEKGEAGNTSCAVKATIYVENSENIQLHPP